MDERKADDAKCPGTDRPSIIAWIKGKIAQGVKIVRVSEAQAKTLIAPHPLMPPPSDAQKLAQLAADGFMPDCWCDVCRIERALRRPSRIPIGFVPPLPKEFDNLDDAIKRLRGHIRDRDRITPEEFQAMHRAAHVLYATLDLARGRISPSELVLMRGNPS